MKRTIALAFLSIVGTTQSAQAAVTLAGTDRYPSIWLYNRTGAQATVVRDNPTGLRDDTDYIETNTLPVAPISLATQIDTSNANATATASASAKGTAMAVFESTAKGTVTFTGTLASDIAGSSDGYAQSFTENHFRYVFSSDQDATLTINYLLTGPVAACCSNGLQLVDRTEYSPDTNFYRFLTGNDQAVSVTSILRAGHIYDLSIDRSDSPGFDVPAQNGPGSTRFANSSTFSFLISSAVPEPSSWAMMLLGFGVIGYAMRRKTVLRYV